jgi:ribokinase
VGQDERGDRILRQLAAEKVDVEQVHRDPGARTGVALILVDDSGEKQILTALGANRRLTEADVEAAKGIIASAKVLLAQLEVLSADREQEARGTVEQLGQRDRLLHRQA